MVFSLLMQLITSVLQSSEFLRAGKYMCRVSVQSDNSMQPREQVYRDMLSVSYVVSFFKAPGRWHWRLSHSRDIARMADVDCNRAMAILYENKCMVKTEMSE